MTEFHIWSNASSVSLNCDCMNLRKVALVLYSCLAALALCFATSAQKYFLEPLLVSVSAHHGPCSECCCPCQAPCACCTLGLPVGYLWRAPAIFFSYCPHSEERKRMFVVASRCWAKHGACGVSSQRRSSANKFQE